MATWTWTNRSSLGASSIFAWSHLNSFTDTSVNIISVENVIRWVKKEDNGKFFDVDGSVAPW